MARRVPTKTAIKKAMAVKKTKAPKTDKPPKFYVEYVDSDGSRDPRAAVRHRAP